MHKIGLSVLLLSGCSFVQTPKGIAATLDLNEDGQITADELEHSAVVLQEQASELKETKLRLEERTAQVKGFTDLFQGITQANNKCIESLTEHANECLTDISE